MQQIIVTCTYKEKHNMNNWVLSKIKQPEKTIGK